MQKILYVGDVGVQTGFGRVAEYFIPVLAQQYEVHALCTNWHGDPNPMQQYCKMYPAMAYGTDPFGSHRILDIVTKVKPNLVFIVNDIWVAISLHDRIEKARDEMGFKTCIYTPIDSYGLFPNLLPHIEKWDRLVTYTEFAKKELEIMGYTKPIRIIGHGTDFTKFFPMDKNECRKALGVPDDVFVVFNGNRNQPRKRIDLTIKAFIKFAKDKDDARLWLNMGTKDLGWPIVDLFKRVARDEGYDPTSKLILTSPHFSTDNCLPIEQLNQVYNACDIGINTCIGEGWGLVNTEHGSTGVMQLVPNHTSLAEIFDELPRIECNAAETDRNYGLERLLPDPNSAAELLTYYYENRDILKEHGQWCYKRLHEEQFTWPYIQQQLKEAVSETLATTNEKSVFKGFGTPAKIG